MAEKKVGRVVHRKELSPVLSLFRVMPDDGGHFPPYKAGQYMALSRDSCKLTRKITDEYGNVHYEYDRDESGNVKRGTVTHSYSIASAPIETEERGYLEFYVVLELVRTERPGRLSESLFNIDPASDNKLYYVNKITGEFTLERRAAGFDHVFMVGTGTGLAPFASMVKQLHAESLKGNKPSATFTLLHANRTFHELAYHEQFLEIEESKSFDFVYVPSVSRPSSDPAEASAGRGRGNNILRMIMGMPVKEEEDLIRVTGEGEAKIIKRAEENLKRLVKPVLSKRYSRELLFDRIISQKTVILTCGNPQVMEDIKHVAEVKNIAFEKEDW
jgi:ferredoxin-NADP reductase